MQHMPTSANRLGGEASLYLRQHAANPVHWQPWDVAALAEARRRDVPIFLSSGYSSCHWCHVMEREVFEQADCAEALNSRFVCIKLDREERPEIDAVYMRALQLLTGGGGWPLNLFLTPQLEPFYGATYVPREQFLLLCAGIGEAWQQRRNEIAGVAAQLREAVADVDTGSHPTGVPGDDSLLDSAATALLRHCDQRWGGLSGQMKFPLPPLWSFALHRWRRGGEPRLEAALRLTLDSMASGGLRDQLGGGFHRYTVEPTWLVPHFEKMLYDNAQLASLYLEAGAAWGEDEFSAVGRQTLDFLLRELRTDEGAFAASFDADSGGAEGSYYLWTPEELRDVCGAADGAALGCLFGVAPGGNFEGRSILTLRLDPQQAAAKTGRSYFELLALLEQWRPALLQRRAQRTAPARDAKVVTAWNGMALHALAQGYLASGERSYLQAAEQGAQFLLTRHVGTSGELARASTAGRLTGAAILDDYAQLAGGLLTLAGASANPSHLAAALGLLDAALARFTRPEGGYYLSTEVSGAPLGRQLELADNVEPSGMAALLSALLRAAALTGRSRYYEALEALLDFGRGPLGAAPLGMPAWADALLLLGAPMLDVTIAATAADGEAEEMYQAVQRRLPPHAVLSRVPAAGPTPQQLGLQPLLAGKLARDGRATAYICQAGACQAPVHSAAELLQQLWQRWAR
jgi:uncharacterized protein